MATINEITFNSNKLAKLCRGMDKTAYDENPPVTLEEGEQFARFLFPAALLHRWADLRLKQIRCDKRFISATKQTLSGVNVLCCHKTR